MADTTLRDDQSKGGADIPGIGLGLETTAPTTTFTSPPASNDNKFQLAVAAWRSLDLSTLVKALDTTAEEMVTQQKDSLVQRKDLAAKTKEFRKLSDEAKLAEMKDLLKAYQGYIDVVTTHNKAVSSAFMQVYSPLSEAPDPYPLLEASIDALITADEVVPRLEGENERLRRQVEKMNGLLEENEKQLETERHKRQSFEGSQDSRVKEVEESWTKVLSEKEENWTSKEQALEAKVENQERLLKELKASYEVSQRLEKSGEDQDGRGRHSAAAAELEIVNSELEKTALRLSDMEARNEQLRLELAQSATQSHSSGRNNSVEEDPAFLRLRSENSSLLRRLDTARFDRDADKTNLENRLRSLERELTSLKTSRETLQTKVHKWSDYDELKRELEMIRAIEFSSNEDFDQENTTTTNSSQPEESLEKLLVTRNKKLGNELTELRVSHRELYRKFQDLTEEFSGTNMELEKSKRLNAELENDLQKTSRQEVGNVFENVSVAGTYSSRYPTKSSYGSRRGGGNASPTSSIIGGFEGAGSSSPRTLESLRAGGGEVGGGILPMVTAQRDRFKKKIGELEGELQEQYSLVKNLRDEISSLQKDNLNLYEKTRYVSSYSRNVQPTTSGAAYAIGNPNQIEGGSGSGDLEGKYRGVYEQNLSPFAAFRGRESARVLKRMSLPEKVVWRVCKLVMATRVTRNLFVVYFLGLHVFVVMMGFGGGEGVVVGPGLPVGGGGGEILADGG